MTDRHVHDSMRAYVARVNRSMLGQIAQPLLRKFPVEN